MLKIPAPGEQMDLGSLWATQPDLVSRKRKGKKETKSETRGREDW